MGRGEIDQFIQLLLHLRVPISPTVSPALADVRYFKFCYQVGSEMIHLSHSLILGYFLFILLFNKHLDSTYKKPYKCLKHFTNINSFNPHKKPMR